MKSLNPLILCIDTSTSVCSVALGNIGGDILGYRIGEQGANHSALIGTFVHDLLSEYDGTEKLAAVAITDGPGSYTGLRISASFAKGLCLSLDIPLLAINSTEVLARTAYSSLLPNAPQSALYMPMIDARRMEVYTALYDSEMQLFSPAQPLILTEEEACKSFLANTDGKELFFFGDGAEKAREALFNLYPSAQYLADIHPDAGLILEPALLKYNDKEFCNLAYWEPHYLKEYNAKISINKVIGKARTK